MKLAKSVLFIVLMTFLIACIWYGSVASAWLEWLRFSSPRFANDATGQVVYMKTAKGVFYVTSEQNFWLLSLPLSLSPIVLIDVIILVFWNFKSITIHRYIAVFFAVLLCSGFFVSFISFGFGDQVILAFTTGSFNLPPEPSGNSRHSLWYLVDPVSVIALIGISLLLGARRKRQRKSSPTIKPLVL